MKPYVCTYTTYMSDKQRREYAQGITELSTLLEDRLKEPGFITTGEIYKQINWKSYFYFCTCFRLIMDELVAQDKAVKQKKGTWYIKKPSL